MPEADDSHAPAKQPQCQPLLQTPSIFAIEQRVMALEAAKDSNNQKSPTDEISDTIKRGEWWLIRINALSLIATFCIGIIYIFQLSEMRKATIASKDAVSARDALDASSGQFDRSMGQVIGQTAIQWRATQESIKSANAAKSAADTAKQTLRISERAFVTTEAPTINFKSRYVTIGMPNSGHIPSGAVGTVIHEATGSSAAPLRPGEYVPFIEKHWSGGYAPSVPPGKPFSLTVSIPSVIPEQISAGLQTVFVAGTLTYSDGFEEDGPQTWSFCWVSRYIANTTEVLWTPCDPSQYLPVLTKEDKYPSEEYQLK